MIDVMKKIIQLDRFRKIGRMHPTEDGAQLVTEITSSWKRMGLDIIQPSQVSICVTPTTKSSTTGDETERFKKNEQPEWFLLLPKLLKDVNNCERCFSSIENY